MSPWLRLVSPIDLIQICKRGMTEKMPLWFTSADPDTPLHDEVPINTAVVIPIFCFETQQDFFVLLFSQDHMEVSQKTSNEGR